MDNNNNILINILGPTASGKTNLALNIASCYRAEIINADSRQIYKKLDIGTAKPTTEELAHTKHHLIDFLDPKSSFNVATFERLALEKLDKLYQKSDKAILVGGTGLYFKAVWVGIDDIPNVSQKVMQELESRWSVDKVKVQQQLAIADPITYDQIDKDNPRRVLRALGVTIETGKPYSQYLNQPKKRRNFTNIKFAIQMDREKLYQRINRRVDLMMESGLLAEVSSLMELKQQQSMQSVGYRELVSYLEGKGTLKEAIALIKQNSRRYAKRQMTWFRRDNEIHWLKPGDSHTAIELIRNFNPKS